MAYPEPPAEPEPPKGEEGVPAPAPPPEAVPEVSLEGTPLSPETPVEPPLELTTPAAAAEPGAKPKRKGRWIRRILIVFAMVTVVIPVALTAIYRFVPPPITLLMVQRMFEGKGLNKHWKSLKNITPALAQAVIAAEDAKFCEHHGFDIEAIEKAIANNERNPSRMRGGSTISQQTAKNVFLSQDRNLVRKGLEAYFTVLIEALWGKKRIIEVYLNVVEWGPGTYGAEAAAQRYFHVDAKHLTRPQAARLAAILPSPLKWKAVSPGPYVAQRSRKIGAAAVTVRETDLSTCIR